MKGNLALILALAALALSVWGAFRPSFPERHIAAPDRLLTPLPKLDSAAPDCGSASSIKQLMRAHINPTMSRLSFALYHDQSDARFQTLSENAARLLGCIHLAPSLPPRDIGLGGLPDYFRFLGSMQENALGVQSAAMEHDADGARHWFGHLKQDCVACHSRFRVETEASPPP